MKDSFQREINYIRISITDQCNLCCRYCRPQGGTDRCGGVPQANACYLTCEEFVEVVEAAAALGITRVKVTGGEPLLCKDCCRLIGELKRIPGIGQVTLTTNGVLLEKRLPELLEAGLDAVNVSLDTVHADVFRQLTGVDAYEDVRRGIQAALAAGLPVKINSVLLRGINDGEWRELAELAGPQPLQVRFIELMPIGAAGGSTAAGCRRGAPIVYRADAKAPLPLTGISGDEILRRLREAYPDLQEDDAVHGNGPAKYVHIPGFQGSIGFISALHGKFCADCNRIRLTSTGRLKPCLCYSESVDMRSILRGPTPRAPSSRRQALCAAIREAVLAKPGGHCFDRPEEITEEAPMSGIGG
ncbi:MAG: GTP 3',8-cyclase MoaA [Firmicutes bacterium]|nr:GTP 3',8-cyclase MoaA [Bacillota bacterium]